MKRPEAEQYLMKARELYQLAVDGMRGRVVKETGKKKGGLSAAGSM